LVGSERISSTGQGKGDEVSTSLRVLMVEDAEDDAILIARELRRGGYDLTFERVDTAAAFKAMLAERDWDIVIADYSMPGFSGLDALKLLQESGLDLPFIVVSGTIGEDVAVAAMKAGAHDYVMKDKLARLIPAVRRELREAKIRRARKRAEEEVRRLKEFNENIVQNMSEGIVVEDADGFFTFVNPAAATLLGYEPDELVGQHWTVLVPPDQQPIVQAADERRARGAADRYELVVVCKDGTRIPVLVSGSPRFEGGRFVGTLAVFTDITERKRAEEALRAERAYLEQLFESSSEAIVLVDNEGRLLRPNSEFLRLFGYTLDEVLGHSIDELLPPDDLRQEALAITKQVARGEKIAVETVRRHKDGTLLDVAITGTPVVIDGAQVAVYGIYRDIAERKRAERLLQALNRAALAMERALTLDEIFAAAAEEFKTLGFSCMVFPTDESRSRLFARYLSYDPKQLGLAEKLVGHGHEDFSFAIESTNMFREIVRERKTVFHRSVEEPVRQILPPPARKLAGRIVSILNVPKAIGAPLIVEDEVIGVLTVQSDDLTEEDMPAITAFAHQMAAAWRKAQLFEQAQQEIAERKRVEEALRRRNRELTTLYEIDRDISATLELPVVLERIATHARDLLEADDSEVYLLETDGQTLRAIVALGDYADEVKATPLRLGKGVVGYVAHSGIAEIVEHAECDPRSVHIPGTPEEEEHTLICVPLVSKGQVIGVMSLARPSERGVFDQDDLDFLIGLSQQAAIAIENARLYAAEQQRSAELACALERQQELDRLKSEFIQNVSHELRTPLAIARGYAELLDSGGLGELQPDQCKPVSIIARRMRMLTKLMDDFTAILETEAQVSKREWVDLADLIHKILTDFQIVMEQAGLTLTAQVASDLPPVLGDPVHLRRVLDNLLGNACKFTPVGGRVSVRLVQDGGNLVLEVADTGIGIPQDQLDRIFERFYQVDGSMSRRYGGAGLGLALVKEIIEAHGGAVGVESEVGQGSTFTVTLPISEGAVSSEV